MLGIPLFITIMKGYKIGIKRQRAEAERGRSNGYTKWERIVTIDMVGSGIHKGISERATR